MFLGGLSSVPIRPFMINAELPIWVVPRPFHYKRQKSPINVRSLDRGHSLDQGVAEAVLTDTASANGL
jgi:hypothetical protein